MPRATNRNVGMETTILLMRSSTRRPSPSGSMSLIQMINSATVKKKKSIQKFIVTVEI